MKLIFISYYLFTIIQCGYYIRNFVGFGQIVPKNNDEYVKIKPDDQPYLGIEEQSILACQDLSQQLEKIKAIRKIKYPNDNIRQGDIRFSFIGHSQGGLVARHVFLTCKQIQIYVKRIITLGTPNLGINQITFGEANSYQDDEQLQNQSFIQDNFNQPKLAQNQLATGQSLFKSVSNFIGQMYVAARIYDNQCPKVYLNNYGAQAQLIQFLNLEHIFVELNQAQEKQKFTKQQFQELYQKKYLKYLNLFLNLEIFQTIGFEQENMISPLESPLFGSRIYVVNERNQAQKQSTKDLLLEIKQRHYQKQYQECQQECNEIQNDSDYQDQCLQECDQGLVKLQEHIQNVIQNFKFNKKLSVDKYKQWQMKKTYIQMSYPFNESKPTDETELRGYYQREKQHFNNFQIPFAEILEVLYNQKKFRQCAVTGYHLQMPNDFYFDSIEDKIYSFNDIIYIMAEIDKNHALYEIFMDMFNCEKFENEIII